jgi:hypothetical protein
LQACRLRWRRSAARCSGYRCGIARMLRR